MMGYVAFSGLKYCASNHNTYCDDPDNHSRMHHRPEPKWHSRETRSKSLFNNDQEAKDNKDRNKEHEEISGDKAGEEIVDGATYREREYYG